jgi:hypothetical protein
MFSLFLNKFVFFRARQEFGIGNFVAMTRQRMVEDFEQHNLVLGVHMGSYIMAV